MLSRRKAIALGTTGIVTTALMGQVGSCSVTTSVPQWLTALQSVATVIGAAVPELVLVGLPAESAAAVNAAIVDIQQVIGALTSASTVATGASVLTQVENYINYIAPLVLPFVSLIPGGAVISLIVASLPAIEALIGLLATTLSTAAQSLITSAPALGPAKVTFGDLISSQRYLDELNKRAAAERATH